MNVAGLQAEPVHGREMADGIALWLCITSLGLAVVPEVK